MQEVFPKQIQVTAKHGEPKPQCFFMLYVLLKTNVEKQIFDVISVVIIIKAVRNGKCKFCMSIDVNHLNCLCLKGSGTSFS